MARPVASRLLVDLVDLGRRHGLPPVELLAATAAAVARRCNLPVDLAALPLTDAVGGSLGGPLGGEERVRRDGAVADGPTIPAVDGPVASAVGAVLAEHDRHGVDDNHVVASVPVPGPDLLGQLHEALLDRGHRHRRGVYYTPAPVADGIVALLTWPTARDRPRPPTVCDPAVGGGAFLLAAARLLEARGYRRRVIVEDALFGVDVDPLAVAVARSALVLWAAEAGETARPPAVVVGDSLLEGRAVWAEAPVPLFDVVVGNPPFQSQLGQGTARPADGPEAERLRRRFGPLAFRYTDTAALFLLEACRWVRPGGQVSLVLPQSVLVAADAEGLRGAVLAQGALEALWVAGEDVFAASVRVCAPVIAVGAPPPAAVRVRRGSSFVPVPDAPVDGQALRRAPTWAGATVTLRAAPVVALPDGPTLSSRCDATAGFRDQFYGLVPFVREAGDVERAAPLLTCGLIDPVRRRWGERPTRFAGRRWSAPVVDLDALEAGADAALVAWTRRRLVPKLVVATQTRVLEAVVDEEGADVPSVPAIAVTAHPGELWLAAAVVLAPPVSAWALARHAGAALSDDALRISARQLLAVPLPRDGEAWAAAAERLRRAAAAGDESAWRGHLDRFGRAAAAAYGVGGDVVDWWLDRLPARPAPRSSDPPA